MRRGQPAAQRLSHLFRLPDDIQSFRIENNYPLLEVPHTRGPHPVTFLERAKAANMELHGQPLGLTFSV